LKHRAHRLIDRLLLGREHGDVHAWMDEPAKYLGERHRALRHSPVEVLLKYWDKPEKALSGLLHILTDEASRGVGVRNWRLKKRRRG
jgi:hypothetical protein